MNTRGLLGPRDIPLTRGAPLQSEDEASRPSWIQRAPRLAVLGWAVLLMLGLYGIRLWQLQFLESGAWLARAETQQTKLVTISPPRGVIFDRNGNILVRNIPAYNVTITPGLLPTEPEQRRAVLLRLAQLIDKPYSTTQGFDIPQHRGELGALGRANYPPYGTPPAPGILERVNEVRWLEPFEPIIIAQNVERELALLIAQEGGLTMPGIDVQIIPRRQYPYAELTSQVMGYVLPIPPRLVADYEARGYDASIDRIGYDGVEYQYEEYLRGTPGRRVIEKDVLGRELAVQSETLPNAGDNLHLTLDIALQQVADESLHAMLQTVGSRRGAVVVLDPRDGQVLALTSYPTYDNNLFSRPLDMDVYQALLDDPHTPFVNHPIHDQVPPGSVFKIVPAAAGLQEGVINRYTTINCPGRMFLPNMFFPDDQTLAQPFYCWIFLQYGGGHGPMNVVDAIAQSCDTFFYQVGGGFPRPEFRGLGADTLAAYAEMFGFGSRTGIDLPAESSGLVPTPRWKRQTTQETWTTGNTYNFAIGQGDFLATPLQIANSLAVVANGGTLYQPQIVHHITDAEGNIIRPFTPIVNSTLNIDAPIWEMVREGLDITVGPGGTGHRAQLTELGINVAGKTGTAEYCDDIAFRAGRCDVTGLETLPVHAWFMSYAPVEAPEIVVTVWIYDGGEGSVAAAPVARDVMDFYFRRQLGLLEDNPTVEGEVFPEGLP